jgi:hypothetical protein
MSETVLSEIRNNVALLTLNRPDKLNSLNYELIDRLMVLLDAIERDRTVRVVILTGAGRAFSSGADIAGFAPSVRQGQEVALRDFVRRGQQMTVRIETFPEAYHRRRERPRAWRRIRNHGSGAARHRKRAGGILQGGDFARFRATIWRLAYPASSAASALWP